ncbi:hypothetical protein [Treponema sp. Marseille-Q3903]|uniref:hypothetical protein n=1 Tax=Treponema sp. Marseille-Q3903 TaxID=2766703 RepID=UPI001651D962|nr:hypothetical protein [Treponema sp. Marseille-Q3903]MBC6713833.1 hypothetical protein [Treponema sp. Marseille-Q3903]
MIDFFINGQKIDVQIEDEQTIGDVLSSFEKTCEENQAAVIGIAVDGKTITAETFDDEALKPLSKNMKFEFSVVTKSDIQMSLTKLSELFANLAGQMESVPSALQSGKNKEVSESIKNVADSIDQFCHVAALASLFPETFKIINIDGVSFKDFFADFSPILKDFEDALKNNDTVMIGDLSEYEICPRLQAISKALEKR